METSVITNADNVIDSRDVIARIESLRESEDSLDEADRAELNALSLLAVQACDCSDWVHGESLIRESYFVEHTRQLVDDCFEMPEEMNSGKWPYRHMKIDWEAAAQELKDDYTEVTFDGVLYFIRS